MNVTYAASRYVLLGLLPRMGEDALRGERVAILVLFYFSLQAAILLFFFVATVVLQAARDVTRREGCQQI